MKENSTYRWLVIILLITVFGGFLRLYGLDWGLPWRYHVDENAFINAANAMRKAPHLNYLNPKWFYHPSLNIYIVCFLSWFYSLFGSLTLPTVHLLGRLNSAFWGIISIPLLYLLGRRLYGSVVGILAALFFSVTVIHVQMSHFFTPDVTLVFFLMATMYFSTGLMKTGSSRDYLLGGMMAGIGMASKYWAPAIVPLLVAHVIRLIDLKKFSWGENKKIVFSFLIAGAAFFLFSPYVILDAGFAIPKILWWAKKTTGAIPQIWAYQFEGTTPYLFHLTHNLPWDLGWPLALLSLAGLVMIIIRHRRGDILLASWIIPNFLLIGSWYIKSARYLLPVIPFLCLCAAALVGEIVSRRRFRYLGVVLAAAAFIWSALFSLAFIRIYSATHSKTQASEWVYAHIPPGSRLATDLSIPLGARNGLPDLFPEEQLGFTYLFESDLSPTEKTTYLDGILARNDYVIMADALREYFTNSKAEHAAEKKFLDDLFAGRQGFSLIKTFKEYPRLGGWIINDDGAELSFHYFDHPAIYIFKRNNERMTRRRPSGNSGPAKSTLKNDLPEKSRIPR